MRRKKILIFYYVLLGIILISPTAWTGSWSSWSFFEKKFEKSPAVFEPNSKSCNVEFSTLEPEQQQECFNYFKNFTTTIVRSNPQVENYITSKTIQVEVLPTANSIEGENPTLVSPPMPGLPLTSPPMPGITAFSASPPMPGVTSFSVSPPMPGKVLDTSPPMPGFNASPPMPGKTLDTSPPMPGITSSPPMPGVEQ